jgi:hypothetical protein
VSPGRTGRTIRTLLGMALVASGNACAMPDPTTPDVSAVATSPGSPEATASANPTSRPSSAVATPRPGTGPLELEVVEVDTGLTTPLLDIASTGSSIIYSSGAAIGPEADVAPDLYRIIPGQEGAEMIWRNPVRDRTIMRIGGDHDVVAFVDGSSTGERSWVFWLIDGDREPIELDRHPGDEDVSSAAPSFDIDQDRIAWTSFDAGPNGTVSQLFIAEGPEWEPRLLEERLASEGELWLPSLLGDRLAYTEVSYGPNYETSDYHVIYRELLQPNVPPRQLDEGGHASNPLVLPHEVIWKQPERGYNMFNWGYLVSYSLDTGETTVLDIRPQDYINYPTAGLRFVGGFGWNLAVMTVYDTETRASRIVDRYPDAGRDGVDRANISGDLMAWVHITIDELGIDDTPVQLRYAWLPLQGSDSR